MSGNSKLQRLCALVLILLVFSASSWSRADFTMIDNFDSYSIGDLHDQSDGTGTWETDYDNFVVEVDPTDADNKVLSVLRVLEDGTRSAQLSDDENLSIEDGRTATFFFRFYRGDAASSMNWGLTDLDLPTAWNDFQIQLRNDFGDTFDVKGDGAQFLDTPNVEPVPHDEWINAWVVIDQGEDVYESYFQSDQTYQSMTKLETDGVTAIGDPTMFGFVSGTDNPLNTFWIRSCCGEGSQWGDHTGPWYIDDLYLDTSGENLTNPVQSQAPRLQAGDADQDLDFDQLDLVRVQVAAKYLTGQAATWGDGDWDGRPGGEPGNPPTGNGLFDQLDIIAALAPGHYLTGPYAAVVSHPEGDGHATLVYDPNSGRVEVQVGATQLTSINIDSAAGIFTGEPAQNLGGSFDNDVDGNIFKATFGSSFGSLNFGNVAQPGLSSGFVVNDLTVVGSLQGGGSLGDVDLIYVPEPSSLLLAFLGLVGLLRSRRGPRAQKSLDQGTPVNGAAVWANGYLPAAYQGTLLRPSGSPILNLARPTEITSARQRREFDTLSWLNRQYLKSRPHASELEARISAYELAFRMLWWSTDFM